MNANDSQSISILIIDDHVLIRQSLRDILLLGGYEVQLAATARQGLQLLSTTEPNLIVCDLLLPDISGLQFFQQVRAQPARRHIPFIFLSGSREMLNTVQAHLEPTVIACLPKPFAVQELLDAVARGVSAPRV